MKKKIATSITIILFLLVLYFIGTGLMVNTGVYVEEYTVSEDGTHIDMNVFVASSIGYIGRFSEKKKDNDIYLTFYATFGGINSSLGAGNEVSLDIPDDCKAIYFNRSNGDYQMMLQKNNITNKWERVPIL